MEDLSAPSPSPSPRSLQLDSGSHHQPSQHEQQQLQEHLRRVNSSLNALSLGFLAAAILVSAFLLVALVERFFYRRSVALQLQPESSSSASLPDEPSSAAQASQPLSHSQNLSALDKRCLMGVSVLMPGQDIPTFIASPAPILQHQEAIGLELEKVGVGDDNPQDRRQGSVG